MMQVLFGEIPMGFKGWGQPPSWRLHIDGKEVDFLAVAGRVIAKWESLLAAYSYSLNGRFGTVPTEQIR